MGLRLALHWFDKQSELAVEHEYSSDFGDDSALLKRLGIAVANNINNGYLDVEGHWLSVLQPLFYHWIDLADYHYQLAFIYKVNWHHEELDKQGRNMVTEQYISIDELVGIPFPYPLSSPPKGWFACQGQTFDKEKYPKLALCYPNGKLPDLRGEFIRGWDAGRNADTNRALLSEQGDAIRNITGKIGYAQQGWGVPPTLAAGVFKIDKKHNAAVAGGEPDDWGAVASFDASRTVPTANENRPRNIAFNYIVKAG